MGDMSLGGTVVQVRNLAECMQVAFDAGAKRILLPMSSVTDIPTIPGELFAKFQTSFIRIRSMLCSRPSEWSCRWSHPAQVMTRMPSTPRSLSG
jgi:hypothetical protein